MLEWDFAKALIAQGSVTEKRCIAMFEKAVKTAQLGKVKKSNGVGDKPGEMQASAVAFEYFVGELSNIQGAPKAAQIQVFEATTYLCCTNIERFSHSENSPILPFEVKQHDK